MSFHFVWFDVVRCGLIHVDSCNIPGSTVCLWQGSSGSSRTLLMSCLLKT